MQTFNVLKTDISFTIFPLNVSEFCLPFSFFRCANFLNIVKKIFHAKSKVIVNCFHSKIFIFSRYKICQISSSNRKNFQPFPFAPNRSVIKVEVQSITRILNETGKQNYYPIIIKSRLQFTRNA